MPLVGICAFRSEGGHLIALTMEQHRNCPMLDSCGYHLAEYGDNLLRQCICAEIIVAVWNSQKPVTHSSPDNVEAKAVLLEH